MSAGEILSHYSVGQQHDTTMPNKDNESGGAKASAGKYWCQYMWFPN